MTLTAYVYGTAAAGIYLRLTQGATNGDSSALAATNTWTQLTATLTPSDAYQPLFVSLVNTTAVAAYFDLAHLYSAEAYMRWVPYSSAYQQLANIQSGPYYAYDRMPQFYERGYGFTPDRHYSLTAGEHMRLTGVGWYPTLSADTDEIDLSEEEAMLLASKAAILVLGRCIATTHLSQNDKWSELQAMLMRDDARLTSQLRRQTPALRIGSWRD